MKNQICGMLGVEAINSNFNANWENEPKNINNKLFATDVCFKYAMKRALNADGEKILGLKRIDTDNNVFTLQDTYEYLFDTKIDNKTTNKEAIQNLLTCKDVKMFGTTFAVKNTTIGITGAIQLDHGINILKNTQRVLDNILSPYASGKDKKAATNGEDFIVDKAHYIYNFRINPAEYEKYADMGGEFTEEDYKLFKEYSMDCVTRLNSRPKFGCENHFAMFIHLKEGHYFIANLRQYLDIIEDDDNITYDFSRLTEIIEDIPDKFDNIEIYYNPASIKVINVPTQSEVFNIITRKEIK